MLRFKTVLICAACALPTVAMADFDWRIAARAGPTFTEDSGFDLVDGEPVAGVTEFLFEHRIIGAYWASLAISNANMSGTAFQTIDARWAQVSIKATAMARWPLFSQIAWFGRLGPTLNRTELELTIQNEGKTLTSSSWDLGVQVGAGLDWSPIYRESAQGEVTLAFGFILEATYQRVVPADIEVGDAKLGSLDPSGPGLTLGLSLAW